MKKFLAQILLFYFLLSPFNSNAMPFFNKNKLPTTPVSVPIDISKKGNKADDIYGNSGSDNLIFIKYSNYQTLIRSNI